MRHSSSGSCSSPACAGRCRASLLAALAPGARAAGWWPRSLFHLPAHHRRDSPAAAGALPLLVRAATPAARAGWPGWSEQLPDALDLLTRALRAGHAFTAGLQDGRRGNAANRSPANSASCTTRSTSASRCSRRLTQPVRARADHRPALLRRRRADPARVGRQPDRGADQPEPADSRSALKLLGRSGCCRRKAGCRPGSCALMPFVLGGAHEHGEPRIHGAAVDRSHRHHHRASTC